MELCVAFGLIVIVVAIFIFRDEIGDKYFFLSEFLLITIGSTYFYTWKDNKVAWDYITAIGGGATLALAFLALIGYLDYITQEDYIEIKVKVKNDKSYTIPTDLKRRDFTRSDVKGILRDIHNDTDGYSIKYLAKPDFMQNVVKIKEGKLNVLEIPIEADDRFNYTNIKQSTS